MRDSAIPGDPRPMAAHDVPVGARIVKKMSSYFLSGTVRPKEIFLFSETKVDWPSTAAAGVEKRSAAR